MSSQTKKTEWNATILEGQTKISEKGGVKMSPKDVLVVVMAGLLFGVAPIIGLIMIIRDIAQSWRKRLP